MVKPLFERFADDYAHSRPGYPLEIKKFLFETFSINTNSIIADIACGSGSFTQLLGCEEKSGLVIGIDRSLPLVKAGARFYHDLCFVALSGCGEMLPLKSQSCDMVTVAQGFHWMHRQKSLGEIARVLKPGGGMGLIWYRFKDIRQPHDTFVEKLIRQYNPNYDPRFMDANYVGMIIEDGHFTDIGQQRFYGSTTFDFDTYIKWQRSKSFVGDAMETEELEQFLHSVKSGIKQFFPDGRITEEFKYDLVFAKRK
jgi:ubiquinone/menaquinone biosynthesis C-methylase UbiE